MIKEFCFPRMTNSVEICKQLRSLSFINVKLKGNKFSNGNCMSVVVLQYTLGGQKYYNTSEADDANQFCCCLISPCFIGQ